MSIIDSFRLDGQVAVAGSDQGHAALHGLAVLGDAHGHGAALVQVLGVGARELGREADLRRDGARVARCTA